MYIKKSLLWASPPKDKDILVNTNDGKILISKRQDYDDGSYSFINRCNNTSIPISDIDSWLEEANEKEFISHFRRSELLIQVNNRKINKLYKLSRKIVSTLKGHTEIPEEAVKVVLNGITNLANHLEYLNNQLEKDMFKDL